MVKSRFFKIENKNGFNAKKEIFDANYKSGFPILTFGFLSKLKETNGYFYLSSIMREAEEKI